MSGVVDFICQHKVVVICRGVYGKELIQTIDALYKGGVRLVEVTFDQKDPNGIEKTMGAIQTIKENFPEIKVGAGTVTKIEHVEATKQAGGEFCLSPDVNVDVIQATKQAGLVSIPGAMTPTEILKAHHAGADMVKIFPAGYLGLNYLKDIKGPINHVKFLAAAGVKEENFKEFLEAGYSAAGISTRLIDKKVIADKNFEELTNRAKVFTEIAHSVK